MVAPKTTIWALDAHTAAKHAILQRYLEAWLPILSHGQFPRISYVDGFAGPGKYSNGEDGSPIIALKAMIGHSPPLRAKVDFHFVELDKERAKSLSSQIEELFLESGKPSNINCFIYNEEFESAFPKIQTALSSFGGTPTFAFIDPFGWKLPFSIVSRIMARPSCEVLINFMFEEINRFLAHPDQVENFDKLFGCEKWRECLSLSGNSRTQCVRNLYADQLRSLPGGTYVRYFEMKNPRNATDYYLFFATKNFQGLKKMKAAMWKVDQAGQFTFSDATDPRQVILFNEPNFGILRKQIESKFLGSTVNVSEVERFVVAETAFRETHFKLQILKPMEAETRPRVRVVSSKAGRKKGTFPEGTVISFE